MAGGPTSGCPCPLSTAAVKVHRNFKEALTIKLAFSAEGIYGGQLLGVRGQDFIVFYDWATGKVGSAHFFAGCAE